MNPLVVVAHDRQTGEFYAEQFGEPDARVITEARDLYRFGPNAELDFVYVNSDNGWPDRDVIDRLLYLESVGVTVDWLGMDPN